MQNAQQEARPGLHSDRKNPSKTKSQFAKGYSATSQNEVAFL